MSIYDVVGSWGKVAGVAGMSFGVLLILFRQIVKLNIWPQLNTAQATRVLTLLIVLTFAIAALGIVVWANLERSHQALAVFLALRQKSPILVSDANAASPEAVAYLKKDLGNDLQRFESIYEDLTRLMDEHASPQQKYQIRSDLEGGDPSSAVDQLRDLARKGEGLAKRSRMTAAGLLEFSGRFREAEQEYVAVSRLDPADSEPFSRAFFLALNVGDKTSAQKRLTERRAFLGPTPDKNELAYVVGLEAIASWYEGDNEAAIKGFDQALVVLDAKPSIYLAEVLNNSAAVYDSVGDHARARSNFAKAWELFVCFKGALHPQAQTSAYNLGAQLIREGKLKQAEKFMEHANFEADARHWTGTFRKLALEGGILLGRGDEKSALEKYRQAQSILEENGARDSYRYGRLMRFIGELLLASNDLGGADEALQQSFGVAQKISGRAGQETLVIQSLLAVIDARRGKARQALDTISIVLRGFPQGSFRSPDYAEVLSSHAEISLLVGKPKEAFSLAQQSCGVLEGNESTQPMLGIKCQNRLLDISIKVGERDFAKTIGPRIADLYVKRNARDADVSWSPKPACEPLAAQALIS